MDAHGYIGSERQLVAVAHDDMGVHLARYGGKAGGCDLGFAVAVLDVAATGGKIFLDMGAARLQEGDIGFVDHDLCLAAGHFPQGEGTADMVDVAMGQQDPAQVFDLAAQLGQTRRNADRGRACNARVDDRGFTAVNEKAVKPEAAPLRKQGVNVHGGHGVPFRKAAVSANTP